MAARTIDGPEKDWLDMRDMTHLTRLSESTIERLIERGLFPPQRQVSDRARFWHWSDYVFWSLRVQIFGLPTDSDAAETPEKRKISGVRKGAGEFTDGS